MAGRESRKKRRLRGEALTIIPLYLFTLVFVAGPLVYMVVLSFLTRAETWGVVGEFTLENYADIFQPVYLQHARLSIKLAVISTVLIAALGTPSAILWRSCPPSGKSGPCCC